MSKFRRKHAKFSIWSSATQCNSIITEANFYQLLGRVKVHRSGSSTTAKKGQARGVMKLRVCNDFIYHPKWPKPDLRRLSNLLDCNE